MIKPVLLYMIFLDAHIHYTKHYDCYMIDMTNDI